MAVVNTYRVLYHFEIGGKSSSGQQRDYVQASAGDYTTLKGVLSSNSRLGLSPGATLVIDAVEEVAHGDVAIA